MTLSIEVLPAPFGPMMARISPLRISKETSTSARTPPNASDTRSTESSTSPAATSRAEGALMLPLHRSHGRATRRPDPPAQPNPGVPGFDQSYDWSKSETSDLDWRGGSTRRAARCTSGWGEYFLRCVCIAPHPWPLPSASRGEGNRRRRGSCGLLQVAGRRRVDLHVADRDARADHALAAVLEGHRGGNVGLLRAVVERLDQRGIPLADEAAPHFLGTGELAVIRIELLVQHQEAPDLRPGHDCLPDQRPVHLVDVALDHVVDQRMAGELLIGAVDDVVALGPAADRDQIDVDHDADEIAPVAEPADVLGPVDDLQMPGLRIEEAGVPGMHPAVRRPHFRGLFRILVIAGEHARRAEQHFAALRDLDLDLGRRLADRIGENLAVRLRGDIDGSLGLSVELLQ